MVQKTHKKTIKFKDLQQYARENSYTVRRLKSKIFLWKKNESKVFNTSRSVKETMQEIKFDIENKKALQTFKLLSEGF